MSRHKWKLPQWTLWIFLVAGVSCVPAGAKDTTQDLYKSKCQICHGVDGNPTVAGKTLGARDLRSSDVRGESDAQLTEIIAKGKNKMPAYEKSLKPDEIKGLVSYVRELEKKQESSRVT